MRIEYEGQFYYFDMADITIKQAIKIEKHLGYPITEFGSRLDTSDGKSPDMAAVQCLGWLILYGGQGIPIEDTDFRVAALTAAVNDAMIREAKGQSAADSAPAAAPDPTVTTA